MHQFKEKHISDHDPYMPHENDSEKNNFVPNWLKHNANITFRPGRLESNKTAHLPNFETQALFMIQDLLLIKGHPLYKKTREWLQTIYIGYIIASYVSAKNLTSANFPNLIRHKLLSPSDKNTCSISCLCSGQRNS